MLSVFALNPFTVITVVYSCTVDGPRPDLAWRTNPSGSLQEIGNNIQEAKAVLYSRHPSAPKTSPKVRDCSFHSGQQKQDTLGGVVRGKRHMAAEVKILTSWWKFMPHAGCLRDGKTMYPISSPSTPQQKKVCTVLPAMTTCDLKGQGFGMYWRWGVFFKFP